MNLNDLPAYYNKSTSTCDFWIWDGKNIALPSRFKGRLILLGVYDLTKERHLSPVVCATTENLNTTTSDNQVLTASEYGKLQVDGIEPELNSRILVKSQTDAKQNGVYTVVSLGGDSEYFSLKRASDASSYAGLSPATMVLVEKGNTLSKHLFQVVSFDQYTNFGTQEINFIDLTSEGFYSNNQYGVRVLNSIMCSDLVEGSNSAFTFANPDFINTQSKRLIKAIIPYDTSIKDLVDSILNANLSFVQSTMCI